jgi:sugar phosphate permease
VPEAHWGTALGANRTMGDVGAMIAPILVGFVIDHRGFDAAFVLSVGILLAAAGLAALLTTSKAPASGSADP